ncbi:MAG TPA: hypothetical protein PK156_43705 [Polyangium sp.]|nr:hypothetical protein [Polyangium sp.]
MRRWWLGLMLVPFLSVPVGCAGQQSGSGDDCPMVEPGTCPKGCFWNGTKCRKDSGAIVWEAASTDGGATGSDGGTTGSDGGTTGSDAAP